MIKDGCVYIILINSIRNCIFTYDLHITINWSITLCQKRLNNYNQIAINDPLQVQVQLDTVHNYSRTSGMSFYSARACT